MHFTYQNHELLRAMKDSTSKTHEIPISKKSRELRRNLKIEKVNKDWITSSFCQDDY